MLGLSWASPTSSFPARWPDTCLLPQERLADEAGLHPTHMGDAERGERNVALHNILRLAKALQIEPGLLLNGLEHKITLPYGSTSRPPTARR